MTLIIVKWLVFVHVLSALTFYMAHGTSVAMAFKIRAERDFGRMRGMLDLSGSTVSFMGIAFLAMGLSGLGLAGVMNLWGKLYIWLSIVLLVLVVIYMAFFNQNRFNELRRLLGMPYRIVGKEMPAEAPAEATVVAGLLKKIRIMELISVGYIVPGLILWLMVFKVQ
jgi:hypothetical protein